MGIPEISAASSHSQMGTPSSRAQGRPAPPPTPRVWGTSSPCACCPLSLCPPPLGFSSGPSLCRAPCSTRLGAGPRHHPKESRCSPLATPASLSVQWEGLACLPPGFLCAPWACVPIHTVRAHTGGSPGRPPLSVAVVYSGNGVLHSSYFRNLYDKRPCP